MVSFGSRSEKENMPNTGNNVSWMILHNDEFNTFEHVIDALSDVCNHSLEQAEQCTLLTHFKGRCEIMKGNRTKLLELSFRMKERSLTVTIE